MLFRPVLFLLSMAAVSCFNAPASVYMRLRAAKPLYAPSRRNTRVGVCSLSAGLDRRGFLAFAGAAAITPFAVGPAKANAAGDVKQIILDGLLRLSNQEPYEGKAVALFSDGSKEFSAAASAVTELGGTVVMIDPKAKLPDIRDKYKDADCFAAIVPNGEVLTRIMSGRGIECQRCGFYGDSAPPKFFIVLGKQTKTGPQIQEEANLLGRECDPKTGVCFQFGKAIDVFTLPELASAPAEQPSR